MIKPSDSPPSKLSIQIPADRTPEQAFAVFELINDLRDAIWQRCSIQLVQLRLGSSASDRAFRASQALFTARYGQAPQSTVNSRTYARGRGDPKIPLKESIVYRANGALNTIRSNVSGKGCAMIENHVFPLAIQTRASGLAQSLIIGYWLLIGLLAAFGIYAVVVSGPTARASAAERLQRTIAEEDRMFCEKFEIHPGTDKFVECSKQLIGIRENASRRSIEDGQGLI